MVRLCTIDQQWKESKVLSMHKYPTFRLYEEALSNRTESTMATSTATAVHVKYKPLQLSLSKTKPKPNTGSEGSRSGATRKSQGPPQARHAGTPHYHP